MAKKTIQEEKKSSAQSARAITRYLHIGPRKVRLVIDTIRRKPTVRAFDILANMNKKAARMTEKVLKSAVANAKVLGLDENRLIITDIRADGGPTFKRFMSRSMGRADRILKRTTHLAVVVKEGEKVYGNISGAAAKDAKGLAPKKKNQKSKTQKVKT